MAVRRVAVVAALSAVLALTTGCDVTGFLRSAGSSTSASPSVPAKFGGDLTSNITPGDANVPLTTVPSVSVNNGTLQSVTLTGPNGPVEGSMTIAGLHWVAGAQPLIQDSDYAFEVVATDSRGRTKNFELKFHTAKLTKDQQTYASFVPADGSTVGIAMPVIIHFDVAVKDHAAIEKALTVTSAPAQTGAWRWISDNEVHWRPAQYWQPGTKVHVSADIAGVSAGNGIFGQSNRSESFTIGRSQVLRVNMATDQMDVIQNGANIRTIPITTGNPDLGYLTRFGTKVIMEKFATIDMNSATVGIDPGTPQGYDLKNVQFAMRLTNSGEFIHAAPWSVAQQGHANVSHGCTGMSVENAQWLFGASMIGDPVEYTPISATVQRPMTLSNGYGDWTIPFASWAN